MKRNPHYLLAICGLIALLTFSCGPGAKQESESAEEAAPSPNTLSDAEKAEGWTLLFDGQSLDGWKRYNADSIGPLWIVQDGMIVCNGAGLTEGTQGVGGSLTSIRQFGNFDFTFEWKLTPGGNSGVLYHVVEKPEYKHAYETGPEYQIMDDNGWDGELHAAQKVGSNYDMFAADTTKIVMPIGEWNTGRIAYNNGHVEQWLNGKKVVDFQEGSPAYEENYKKSKWVDYPGWNVSKTGAISLQDHGANVYFRNLKIKEL